MRRQRPQKIKEEEWRLQRIQRQMNIVEVRGVHPRGLPKQPAQVQAPPESEQAQERKVTKHEMFEEQNRQPQDQWRGETHKEKREHHMDQDRPAHLVQLQACCLLQHHQEHQWDQGRKGRMRVRARQLQRIQEEFNQIEEEKSGTPMSQFIQKIREATTLTTLGLAVPWDTSEWSRQWRTGVDAATRGSNPRARCSSTSGRAGSQS